MAHACVARCARGLRIGADSHAPRRVLSGAPYLSVAWCALRAGGLTRVSTAGRPTSPACSIASSNASWCLSCVQAPCSTWLNLSWCATLRATHALVCDARFSPGQSGEEIAPRSLNRQNARLRQGRARPCHICTGTGLTPAHGLCCCRSTAAPQPRMSVLPTPVDWHRRRRRAPSRAAAESLRAAVPCNNVSCGCADVRSSRGHCRACGATSRPLPRGLVYVATLAFHCGTRPAGLR